MPITVPVVQATVTLLRELTRGRRGLSIGDYRPHIVMGPQTQRVAIRDGNRFPENYLGVMFVGGPDTLEPGETADVKLALMYFLKPNDLQCIGFKTPVVFAESANVPNNAYVADLYEQVSFLGDLHRQIADSPNGGKVTLKVSRPPVEP